MRAAVLKGAGKVTLQERPVPGPGPGEVLVQVAAVGTCGSDVHYYEHGRIGDFVVESPLILGHEPSGVVIAAGPGADRHLPGQRVSIEPGVPDFTCEYCRAGRYNLCPRMRFFGTPPIDGAFCEYVVVSEEFAYPVPDSLSDDAAALVEPLSVGVWACRKARVGPGSRVLVAGAGPIGLVCLQAAKAFGATYVAVTDVNPRRKNPTRPHRESPAARTPPGSPDAVPAGEAAGTRRQPPPRPGRPKAGCPGRRPASRYQPRSPHR